MIVVPRYTDIFDDPVPPIESVLEGVSSLDSLNFLTVANAYLFFRSENPDLEILKFLTSSWSDDIKGRVYLKLNHFSKKYNKQVSLFNTFYVSEFMQYELIHYRTVENRLTNSEIDLRLFKAYLLISQKLGNEQIKSREKVDVADDLLQSKLWTFIIKQYGFSFKPDPIFEQIKSLVFLNELNKDKNTQRFLLSYLENYDNKSFPQLLLDYIRLVKSGHEHYQNTNIPATSIAYVEHFKSILDQKSVDIDDYKNSSKKQENYQGLKEKPLFKTSNGSYLCLNWSFFIMQASTGLLFDFYNKSGINKSKSFPDFQSFISKEIFENVLFKSLIELCFKSKYNVVSFDESKGAPDGYVRINNTIYLFEFKNYLMPSRLTVEPDYEKVTKELDKKFIVNQRGKPKGITQLKNQISFLNENCYSFDNFILRKRKRRRIKIYPIIVYTDFMYSMPGINDYLNRKFQEILPLTEFFSIKPLTMIQLSSFYDHFETLRTNSRLSDIIDDYHLRLKKNKKKLEKSPSVHNVTPSLLSFEYIQTRKMKFNSSENTEWLYELFSALGIEDVVSEK